MTTLKTGLEEKRPYRRKPKKNLKLRASIVGAGIEYKEVAAEMGVNKTELSRLLSTDLSEEKERRIKNAIKAIKERNEP